MKNKHTPLLLLAAILSLSTALAQPRIKAQGVIGGSNDDLFTSMALTSDGGLIVGGYSSSDKSDQKTQNSKGSYDYWIVKLDSNKNIQWDKTIGGSDADFLTALQQTTDGGYILGGYSFSYKSGDKTQDNKSFYGYCDYWIVKIDAAGNIQWDKTIGGSLSEYLYSIQQTSDGGYIFGGYSYSNKSGDKTQDSKGYADYWIVKIDDKGNVRWDKTVGSHFSDYLSALQQTTDGGYILGGYSYSGLASGDKTEANKGGVDFWIVKLDVNGNKLWDETIGGNKDDILRDIQPTVNGGFILVGGSKSGASGDKSEGSRGGYDFWIVKIDSLGKKQWDKTAGGSNDEAAYSVQQTADGGYITAGSSLSNISGEKTENNRGQAEDDYWVVKLTRSGKVAWDKTIGGSDDDRAYAVREIKKNEYVTGGYSISKISGDKTGGIRGPGNYYDYWLVELKYIKRDSVAIAQVSTSSMLTVPQPSTTAFSIYPNPTTTVLHIQNMGKATYVLYDQTGKRMFTKTIEGNGDINVANVPSGTYYLTNTTTNTAQKIIITK